MAFARDAPPGPRMPPAAERGPSQLSGWRTWFSAEAVAGANGKEGAASAYDPVQPQPEAARWGEQLAAALTAFPDLQVGDRAGGDPLLDLCSLVRGELNPVGRQVKTAVTAELRHNGARYDPGWEVKPECRGSLRPPTQPPETQEDDICRPGPAWRPAA